MGMSLDTKAFYGWHLGNEEGFTNIKGFCGDNDFCYYDFSETMEFLRIETAHYYDHAHYFLVIADQQEGCEKPIRIKNLMQAKIMNCVEAQLSKINRDLEMLKNATGLKPKGDAEWFVMAEYF